MWLTAVAQTHLPSRPIHPRVSLQANNDRKTRKRKRQPVDTISGTSRFQLRIRVHERAMAQTFLFGNGRESKCARTTKLDHNAIKLGLLAVALDPLVTCRRNTCGAYRSQKTSTPNSRSSSIITVGVELWGADDNCNFVCTRRGNAPQSAHDTIVPKWICN